MVSCACLLLVNTKKLNLAVFTKSVLCFKVTNNANVDIDIDINHIDYARTESTYKHKVAFGGIKLGKPL